MNTFAGGVVSVDVNVNGVLSSGSGALLAVSVDVNVNGVQSSGSRATTAPAFHTAWRLPTAAQVKFYQWVAEDYIDDSLKMGSLEVAHVITHAQCNTEHVTRAKLLAKIAALTVCKRRRVP